MGRVLQALRQLECKQGSPSSAGSATAQPPDISRQAVVPDDDLAPPPEYLPDGLALRQEPSLSSGGETSVGSDVGRIGNPSSNETVAADNAPPRGAYDELAETILAQIVPGRPAALCFTSVEEGIGRTAMVASLAAALARREPQGVLAVDADFRQPRLGSHFGVLPDPGLAGVLGGRTGWEEAIAATEIPSLFVLPAGRSDWEEKGTVPICAKHRAPAKGWLGGHRPKVCPGKWGLSPFPGRPTGAAVGTVARPLPAGVIRRSLVDPAGSGLPGPALRWRLPGLASGRDPQTGVASRLARSGSRRRASPGKHPLGAAVTRLTPRR